MLVAFQICLMTLMAFLGLATVADKEDQSRHVYGLVTSVAIAALTVTFLF